MPELPEVETVVRGLQRLRGKVVQRVWVRRPKLVSVGPATLSPKRAHTVLQVQRFRRALEGRRIRTIRRRAKLIIFTLDGGWTLLIHLKMAGQIVVQRASTPQLFVRLINSPRAPLEQLPSKHTHITLQFTDGTQLHYNDHRLFGTWRMVHERDIAQVADLSTYGPEPLARTFTWQRLRAALVRLPRAPVKRALTDQHLLAGVGNIYADETLFAARIRPTRQTQSLHDAEWRLLCKSLQRVLRHAIRTHGSSVGEFIRPDGSVGTYGRYHTVYGRAGLPCVRCKTNIRRTTLGGRGTHYCPSCQR